MACTILWQVARSRDAGAHASCGSGARPGPPHRYGYTPDAAAHGRARIERQLHALRDRLRAQQALGRTYLGEKYQPGAAAGAEIQKDGEQWTLVLVRDLRHPPAKVWQALTEPAHLREWAPFDADRSLGAVGTAKLSTVGTPTPHVTETHVKRADAPRALEYSWGGGDLRWELEPLGGGGTRLTLWHNIGRDFISMGAAGWHICFDVLDRLPSRPA